MPFFFLHNHFLSKQHPIYKSLKELGHIYKTIFLLRYFDELPLRQAIEKQLNKIEQAHQFSKAIFFGHNQEFKLETKEEQEISVSCRHLIQNIIVLWNYLKMSEKLTESVDETEYKNILDILKESSIMTWQHINFLGEYDFDTVNVQKEMFDMEKLVAFKVNII